KAGAANVYETLYEYATQMARDPSSSPNLSGVRAAAVTGLIVCRPNEMAPGIVQLMRDEDPMVCIAAINGARLSSYSAPTQALVELMPSLGFDAQIQILALLGDKAETSKIDAITSLLNSGDETVCTAAVDALSQIGSEASASALMETAVNREGALRNAALKDLTVVTGVGVEEFIREKARSGDVKIRVVAIPLLGKRQIPGAIQVLYGYTADKNEEIQSASFQGLSEIAGSVDVASLIGLIIQTKSEKARETGLSTLRTVLSVSQDKESATKTMITQIDKSKKDLKPLLLGTLDALGGSAALGVANNAALSSDEAMRDAGIRTMSEWPDFEATEKLLAIASNPKTSLTHYVLALRGAVRLIQNSNSAPLEDREKLCLAAFDGTRRNEEKILVISAMGSIPSTAIGERLLELAKDESLKAEAGLAAIGVANAMLRTDQTAAQELAQKILDLNISDDINGYAQSIIKGERIRFGGGGR
ncbi:HEAT repeat domain-containing protein, partial [bacterium]|nr:HEAT repeat domain-containing protein [bacterium]